MNFSPILQKLQDDGIGQIGESLFREFMPHDILRGVLMIQHNPIDVDKDTCLRKGKFVAIARSTEVDDARALAQQVSDALRGFGVTYGDEKFHHILPLHDPFVFPQSAGDLIEASVGFQVAFVKTGA